MVSQVLAHKQSTGSSEGVAIVSSTTSQGQLKLNLSSECNVLPQLPLRDLVHVVRVDARHEEEDAVITDGDCV